MNEEVLNALMHLFAIISFLHTDKKQNNDAIVQEYLKERLNSELTLRYFKKYKNLQKKLSIEISKRKREKKLSALSVKILLISEKINLTFTKAEKYLLLLRSIEYIKTAENKINSEDLEILNTLTASLNLNDADFKNILHFVLYEYEKINSENLLIVKNIQDTSFNFIKKQKIVSNIDKPLVFLFISDIKNFLFRYYGELVIRLNVKLIKKDKVYYFESGSIIRSDKIEGIYQTELLNIIRSKERQNQIELRAEKIEFNYPNSKNGIKKVSFSLHSGELIGIIGSSGAGKSTFLKLLSGKLTPQKGTIYLNGIDLHNNIEKLKGLIGYVPQDDILIEELTVYQNLYYTAKLSFGNYNEKEIEAVVNHVLNCLNIQEIKGQKVGSILNQNISGGQRKRLNIALELIREPSILYLDEPTSGLSSTDATLLMHQLKNLSLNEKLIVVNIHQPSSEIFKLFNRIIVIDKGGYVVYIGNPLEAIWYFKSIIQRADADFIQCPTCGNVRSEEILEILEEKIISENGISTNKRKSEPLEWYLMYKLNIEKQKRNKLNLTKKQTTKLPANKFQPPHILKQFFIFLRRDIHSKISDKQYLIISFIESPLLAFITAYLSKKFIEGQYIFRQNNNIPVFLFISVVVAMFLGLSISAEEIFKDKKILEKESFLRLSRFSYLLSKAISLALISAIQMFFFVIVANKILGIKDMFWVYWFTLFTTAFVSNIIGLNISSSFNSIVTIYITIPLILVPQMLLGGAMIKFEDMPPLLKSEKYTPIIADLMIARWSYETLAVEQFKNNKYEKHFFQLDKKRSFAIFINGFWTDEMIKLITQAQEYKQLNNIEGFNNRLKTVKNELKRFEKLNFIKNINFTEIKNIDFENFKEEDVKKLKTFLQTVKQYYKEAINKITDLKDKKITLLINQLGTEQFIKLKKDYTNQKLENIVRNIDHLQFFIIKGHNIIAKRDVIFVEPYSYIGRAQLYASEKIMGNWHIDTFVFNNAVLWIFSFFSFIGLYFEVLKKIIKIIPKKINNGTIIRNFKQNSMDI